MQQSKRFKRKCRICPVIFETVPSLNRQFCVRKCYDEFTRRRLTGVPKSEYVKESLRKSLIGNKRKSQFKPGKLHWNWKGGIKTEYQKKVGTLEWKRLSHKIKDRDGNVCTDCGNTERLQVHHQVPYRITQDDSPENLITLCVGCHGRAEAKCNKLYSVKT